MTAKLTVERAMKKTSNDNFAALSVKTDGGLEEDSLTRKNTKALLRGTSKVRLHVSNSHNKSTHWLLL